MVPYEIIDAVNCVIQGIYRGTGRQHVAAITNAVAYYGVGVPFAGLLAFKFGLGVEGLWIGFGSGIFTAFIVSVVYLYYSSWDQMAKEAQARASN
jgi:MATE family multidrug resistance protein